MSIHHLRVASMERSTTPTSPSSASILAEKPIAPISTNTGAPSGALKCKWVELSPSKPDAYEERKERKEMIAEWALQASVSAATDRDHRDNLDKINLEYARTAPPHDTTEKVDSSEAEECDDSSWVAESSIESSSVVSPSWAAQRLEKIGPLVNMKNEAER
ncbi:hypothetical protein JB92DRAFT_3126591 [Gautieria morchelliformis]|nr:hypothetical protein JB92DRAFT_3126591 [Gautieria morchelliformis]